MRWDIYLLFKEKIKYFKELLSKIMKKVLVILMIILMVFMTIAGAEARGVSFSGNSGNPDPVMETSFFAIAGERNSNCDSEFDNCYQADKNWRRASAFAKIELDNLGCISKSGSDCSPFVPDDQDRFNCNHFNTDVEEGTCLTKSGTIKYRCTGDQMFFYPNNERVSCDENGCQGGTPLSNSGEVDIADYPSLVCWDRDDVAGYTYTRWDSSTETRREFFRDPAYAYSFVTWKYNEDYTKIECGSHRDCNSGEKCIAFQCQRFDCNENIECGEGRVCTNSLCEEVMCVTDEDCFRLEECNNNICERIECKEDFDCAENEFCSNQKCGIGGSLGIQPVIEDPVTEVIFEPEPVVEKSFIEQLIDFVRSLFGESFK
tara:strand:+ start:165 stop:1286 length:1122 start_codon:yes stop_codon:yes gene_type:complete